MLACQHRVETGLRTPTTCSLIVSQPSILLVGNIAEDMEQAGAWRAVRHSKNNMFPIIFVVYYLILIQHIA
jgi:hypothetical protein